MREGGSISYAARPSGFFQPEVGGEDVLAREHEWRPLKMNPPAERAGGASEEDYVSRNSYLQGSKFEGVSLWVQGSGFRGRVSCVLFAVLELVLWF